MTTQERMLVATILYYDILAYPLTALDAWRLLLYPPGYRSRVSHSTLAETMQILERLVAEGTLTSRKGFYVLAGREALIDEYAARTLYAQEKLRRLRRIVSWVQWLPFVRMIGVTGRVAMHNTPATSDLDVFVIYKKGHIWLGRALLTMFLHVCGVRRHGEKIVDRVCLNYHSTTGSLVVPTQDEFSAHEYSFLLPLLDDGGTYSAWSQANAQWIKAFRPHYTAGIATQAHTRVPSAAVRLVQKSLEIALGWSFLERVARFVQEKKIARHPLTGTPGATIIANDAHLVFLPRPHQQRVSQLFERAWTAYVSEQVL